MQKSVFLLGFMGCGKSYWGAILAQQLACTFVDLDEHIAMAEGLSIPEIFAKKGEAEFRIMERQILRETALNAPCVIATGGGAPCFFDNMNWMNATGITIYLKTPVEILTARLRQDVPQRPILQGVSEQLMQQHIEKLLAIRAPFYLQAQHILEYTPEPAAFLKNLLAMSG